MEETIKVRWLEDHEQNKIAPKTLITQVLNENGSRFKDSFDTAIVEMTASIDEGKRQTRDHINNTDVHVTQEEKDTWSNIVNGYATEEYVTNLYQKLNSNTVLGFYCIEPVIIITNGVSKIYPANSNVEVSFIEDDVFEIVPTSDNSILALTAFPGVLGTFYPWLEGVRQFSNILFDMNNEAMYSKWSQGNQGSYQVQFAQYNNCIFWSDNPYISDVAKRTNYTLCSTTQLPLCYSTVPENTFKSFYLAMSVNSDPNWGNPLYKESFANANWATQAFSYYGARVVGFPGHDSTNFNITLPKDCRGLMFDARNIECAGTFDAVNCTNFGAKSGSWREAFGDCISLRRLYIKNLKTSLNISWSPIDYNSIYFIISKAANTSAITIYVSPYTYNLLSDADFELAASKNITIALLSTNYVEDKRLGEIAGKADKTYVDTKIADLVNSAPEALDTLGELAAAFGENKEVVDALNESITNKQNKNVIVYRNTETGKASMTAPEVMEKVRAGENIYYTTSLSGGTLHPYLEGSDTGVFFYSNYIDNDRVIGTGILISADGTITNENYELEHLKDTVIHITSAERNRWNDTYTKTEINLLESYIYPNYLINATTLKAHYDVHQVNREFGLFKDYRFEVETLINVDDPSIALIEIKNQDVLLGHFTSWPSTSADGLINEQKFIFTSNNPNYNLKDKIYSGFDFEYYDANRNIIDISSYTVPCYVRFCEATDSATILTLDEKLIPSTITRTKDLHKVAKTGSWNDLEDKPDQDDALNIAAETGLIEPIVTNNGAIYTDGNGYILTLI